jgi:hypothetical protein
MRKIATFLILSATLISAQTLTNTQKSAPYESETCCIAEIDVYSNATAHLLLKEDFDALEKQAENERATKARFKGGVWRLRTFYKGLEQPLYGDAASDVQWKEHLTRLKKWSDTHPESIAARVALAHSYLNYGWKARGTGYSNTVSQEGWDGFADGGKKASQILMEAAKLKQKDPDFFYAVVRVAQVQGWDPEVARAAVDREIDLEPGYYYPYRMYAMYMLPKWYGEPGDSERFATQVADKIGGKLGDAMYAEMATSLYCGCASDSEVHMSFDRIVRGVNANEELHGTSLEKLNKLAYIAAVSVHSASVAKQVFDRLGDNWDRDTWRKKKELYDAYRRWADAETARLTATKK